MNFEYIHSIVSIWVASVGYLDDDSKYVFKAALAKYSNSDFEIIKKAVNNIAKRKAEGLINKPNLGFLRQEINNLKPKSNKVNQVGCEACLYTGLIHVIFIYSVRKNKYVPIRRLVVIPSHRGYVEAFQCVCSIHPDTSHKRKDIISRLNKACSYKLKKTAESVLALCEKAYLKTQEQTIGYELELEVENFNETIKKTNRKTKGL